MKFLLQTIRRSISLGYGRLWPLRARFISKSLKTEVAEYLQQNQSRLLFVMSSGRSGTQLISNMLNTSGDASVFHEPNFNEDVSTMDILRRDLEQALRYWQSFRSIEIYRRWKKSSSGYIYGEVNGTIRYQVVAIKKLFPKANIFMISRDGRGTVRSVMGWQQFYNPQSKDAFAIAPLPGDPFELEWPNMDRFERICWSWQNTYELLMNHIPSTHWLTLEKLTSDFEYFNRQFIQKIDMDIPFDVWQKFTMRKSFNSTKEYAFPPWKQWTKSQQQRFIQICGTTMRKLGYNI